MNRVHVIVSATGTVSWQTTEHAVKSVLSAGKKDFGAGLEPFEVCAACRRHLPSLFCHLEPIEPYSYFSLKDSEISALDAASLEVSIDYEIVVRENIAFVCSRPQPDGSRTRQAAFGKVTRAVAVEATLLWENNLGNLQYLCKLCRKSKGAQSWSVWKGANAPPSSVLHRRLGAAVSDQPSALSSPLSA